MIRAQRLPGLRVRLFIRRSSPLSCFAYIDCVIILALFWIIVNLRSVEFHYIAEHRTHHFWWFYPVNRLGFSRICPQLLLVVSAFSYFVLSVNLHYNFVLFSYNINNSFYISFVTNRFTKFGGSIFLQPCSLRIVESLF